MVFRPERVEIGNHCEGRPYLVGITSSLADRENVFTPPLKELSYRYLTKVIIFCPFWSKANQNLSRRGRRVAYFRGLDYIIP